MAVRSKQEILDVLKSKFGEDTSDETLAIIEDINDTYDDFETKTKDTTNWETKYKENDAMWRKKYRDRFFSGVEEVAEEKDTTGAEDDAPKNLTFENLFKEE